MTHRSAQKQNSKALYLCESATTAVDLSRSLLTAASVWRSRERFVVTSMPLRLTPDWRRRRPSRERSTRAQRLRYGKPDTKGPCDFLFVRALLYGRIGVNRNAAVTPQSHGNCERDKFSHFGIEVFRFRARCAQNAVTPHRIRASWAILLIVSSNC